MEIFKTDNEIMFLAWYMNQKRPVIFSEKGKKLVNHFWGQKDRKWYIESVHSSGKFDLWSDDHIVNENESIDMLDIEEMKQTKGVGNVRDM